MESAPVFAYVLVLMIFFGASVPTFFGLRAVFKNKIQQSNKVLIYIFLAFASGGIGLLALSLILSMRS